MKSGISMNPSMQTHWVEMLPFFGLMSRDELEWGKNLKCGSPDITISGDEVCVCVCVLKAMWSLGLVFYQGAEEGWWRVKLLLSFLKMSWTVSRLFCLNVFVWLFLLHFRWTKRKKSLQIIAILVNEWPLSLLWNVPCCCMRTWSLVTGAGL